MTMPLALLQEGQDKTLLYIMIVVTLLFAIVLGKRFFVNLFEVITAPTASLHHHGRNETFFFSVAVVIFSGLIGALILMATLPQVEASMKTLAADTGKQLADGNSNPNYRPMAAKWAEDKISSNLETYVVGNLQWLPLVLGFAFWIGVGFLFWLLTKMFGAQATLGNFLGALSYAYFFYIIGLALFLPQYVSSMTNALFGLPATPQLNPLSIVGSVLMLYAMVLFIIAVIQTAEIGGGALVVCIILYSIVVGGGITALFVYELMPKGASFAAQVKSLDPSKSGFHMPGEEGAPPPPSAPPPTDKAPAPGGGVSPGGPNTPKISGGGAAGGSTSD